MQGSPLRGQANGLAPPAAPGQDPQVGNIFRNMRAATRLPREAIARRLATTANVIEELENGSVASLPHWRETVRIVRTYCELLRLNPDPLLWRLDQLLRGGVGSAPDEVSSRPPAPPLALRKPPSRDPPVRQSAGVGRLLLLATPPVAVAALASLAILVPAPIYKAIPLLPAAVVEPARAGLDLLVLLSAPRRQGLRWIDIGDPKLRKVDKLPTKAR